MTMELWFNCQQVQEILSKNLYIISLAAYIEISDASKYTLHVTLQLFGFIFIAGFLGFREAPAILAAFSRLRDTNINLVPECILVDGNGILHPRGFGLASHVGELKCCIAN
jgi:deoxyinosine 3'endonuclease (endonuclease V)